MKLTKVFAIVPVLAMSLIMSCGPKDADIQAKATEMLKSAPGVMAEVKDGVLTLTGNVQDDAAKMAAENAVKSEKGVKSVVNNITVTPPAVAPAAPPVTISPDDALTKGVTDATKDYPGVTAEVKDGVVTVKGTLSADKWKKLKMSLDALSPKKVDASGMSIK